MDRQQAVQQLANAMTAATEYVVNVLGVELPPSLKAVSLDDPFAVIRADYRKRIASAMTEYLASNKPVTSYRNEFRQAAVESLQAAFWNGYKQSAGTADYTDTDAQEWVNSRVESELGFIGELFIALKQLRDQFWHGEINSQGLRDEVSTRTDGYAKTLEAARVAGVMWGAKNQMLTWQYGDTDHCDTCAHLNGQTHRAKWFIARDYIPRKPGSAMDCGGYRCQCKLLDKSGNEIVLNG